MTARTDWGYPPIDIARVGFCATVAASIIEILLGLSRRRTGDKKISFPITRFVYTTFVCLFAVSDAEAFASREYQREALSLLAYVPFAASGVTFVAEMALLFRQRQGGFFSGTHAVDSEGGADPKPSCSNLFECRACILSGRLQVILINNTEGRR